MLMTGLLLGSLPAVTHGGTTYSWSNFAGQPVGSGNTDGPGSLARFNTPTGVAVDSAGNVYVADYNNDTIRKISAAGVVTTLAGSAGQSGRTGGTGSAARFYQPSGVAVDSAGNLFVTDTDSDTIRQVTAAGVVSTLAGNVPGSADGTGVAAQFQGPFGAAVDRAGNVYVADTFNHTIRKVTAAGEVTTLAGNAGNPGSTDGTGSAAQFNHPTGVAVDSSGNVYVADSFNHALRKITAAGMVTTLAGNATVTGSADGIGTAAQFGNPSGVAVDGAGNLYVVDSFNHTIRIVTTTGIVTTLAGTTGVAGSADGTGTAAQFSHPIGVAVDSAGSVFVADTYNHLIRKVTAAGVVTTLAGKAGRDTTGSADGTGTAAEFYLPQGVAVDSAGNAYVADTSNQTIRKVTPGGAVTTLAGNASITDTYGHALGGFADGTGTAARFDHPTGVAVDRAGTIYVADIANHLIRKVSAAGVVTTLAGKPGTYGGYADGTGSTAQFNAPASVAVDRAGNIYVADFYNQTIRKVSAAGVVTTLAGSAGVSGHADGTGSAALFYGPTGVAVDRAGNVFVADNSSLTIRKVSVAGVVTTFAGNPGIPGSADGTGSAARFAGPTSVAVDNAGNVYVTDTDNQTIRKISKTKVVTTIGGAVGIISGTDGVGSAANFNSPHGIAVDDAGILYVADSENNRLVKGTSSGLLRTVSTPTILPAGGTFSNAVKVKIHCATAGATIRYTTDGSEPTSFSSIYKATGLALTNSVTLNAKAFKGKFIDSGVATEEFTIIPLPPPTITTTNLPAGIVKVKYSARLTATSGVTPYKWTLQGSQLPAGLTLNARTGVIAGLPTTAGIVGFTVKVTDAKNHTDTQGFVLVVTSSVPAN